MRLTDNELRELRDVARLEHEKARYRVASTVYQAAFAAGGSADDLLNAAVNARLGKSLAKSSELLEYFFREFGETYLACMEAGLTKLELKLSTEAVEYFRLAFSMKNTAHSALWLGVSLRRSGDAEHALRHLQFASQLDHTLVSAVVEIGACYEALGKIEQAAQTYRSISTLEDTSCHTHALNRLGICLLRLGDRENLANLLDSKKYKDHLHADYAIASTIIWSLRLKRPICDSLILKNARSSTLQGNKRAMFDALTLRLMNASSEISEYRESYLDLFSSDSYGRDALAIMEMASRDVLPHILSSSDMISVDRGIQMLAENMLSQTPFSLIRIGDGEGNFLARGLVGCNEFLDEQCRKILRNWFGPSSTHFESFLPLYNDLRRAINDSDLLGSPDKKRLELELGRDPRGYWGISFASYYASTYCARKQFVEAGIHRRLFENKMFIEALRASKWLHTISCHENFGKIIRNKMDVADGVDLIVPGEMGISELPQNCRVGKHYPERYIEILDEIRKLPDNGNVLVAAGVCGKVYSSAAKQAGCVGIDIGAVADQIMGFATREYLRIQKVQPEAKSVT